MPETQPVRRMSPENHEYERYPKCPRCDHEERDYWEWGFQGDGDEKQHECERCGFRYVATMHQSVSFSTQPDDTLPPNPVDLRNAFPASQPDNDDEYDNRRLDPQADEGDT